MLSLSKLMVVCSLVYNQLPSMSSPAVPLLIFAILCLSWNDTQANDAKYTETLHRACAKLSFGVHANGNLLDPKASPGKAIFGFTFKQGNPWADQILYRNMSDYTWNYQYTENDYRSVPPAYIESVSQLQKTENATFLIDFLGPLDRYLASSTLNLSQLNFFKDFTYGFTYSNEYKFRRDQIDKAKMAIFWFYSEYEAFRLSLNMSALKLSPELTSDLAGSSRVSPQDRAAALVAKYGGLFLKNATFGISYTQNDYVPLKFYQAMDRSDRINAFILFRDGVRRWEKYLVADMRKKTSAPFHRRTSLSHRGGLISPSAISRLPDWADLQENPGIIGNMVLAPLSDLIPESSLKRSVATIVRTQLLRSVGQNFLDIGLFKQESLRKGEEYFSGLVSFNRQTEEQMSAFVGANASALADPSVSPFLKMEAIATALEFMDNLNAIDLTKKYIGLSDSEVESTFASIVKCNKQLQGIEESDLPSLRLHLKKLASLVAVPIERTSLNWFTTWSDGNEPLAVIEKDKVKIRNLTETFKVVQGMLTISDCQSLPTFFAACAEGKWYSCGGR